MAAAPRRSLRATLSSRSGPIAYPGSSHGTLWYRATFSRTPRLAKLVFWCWIPGLLAPPMPGATWSIASRIISRGTGSIAGSMQQGAPLGHAVEELGTGQLDAELRAVAHHT